jgi:hypothetical protein
MSTLRAHTHVQYRVRERLKDVLRQYELREKHFDVIMRSKELELLLARARSHELLSDRERKADVLTALQQQVCDLFSYKY